MEFGLSSGLAPGDGLACSPFNIIFLDEEVLKLFDLIGVTLFYLIFLLQVSQYVLSAVASSGISASEKVQNLVPVAIIKTLHWALLLSVFYQKELP